MMISSKAICIRSMNNDIFYAIVIFKTPSNEPFLEVKCRLRVFQFLVDIRFSDYKSCAAVFVSVEGVIAHYLVYHSHQSTSSNVLSVEVQLIGSASNLLD